ncbi:PREDICTED: uncharacterized protein LOC104820185 [Tarenaya hassleriana]|uniref:uncharacterized protein LOC104820185 n=1 Tax=Tarenaya hassleriana TaxID=28532 RepID=UPI00053C8A43|nr:PREDICTED: uncharacterized protein LOC104820185 [Tarenaya hassleriana]
MNRRHLIFPSAILMEMSAKENRSGDEKVEIEDEGEETMMREIVLGLRALCLQDDFWDNPNQDDNNPDKGKTLIENVVAAEEEAIRDKGKRDKEKEQTSRSGSKKRSKILKNDVAGTSRSGSTKKRAPELIDPPAGPLVCPYCQRIFGSWKAVFGHLRAHKERQHHGFLPPPRFSAAGEGITIGCSGSGAAKSVIFVASNLDGSSGDGDGKSLGFDLNVAPGEDSEDSIISNPNPKSFDLNKSPPKEEDPEEDIP